MSAPENNIYGQDHGDASVEHSYEEVRENIRWNLHLLKTYPNESLEEKAIFLKKDCSTRVRGQDGPEAGPVTETSGESNGQIADAFSDTKPLVSLDSETSIGKERAHERHDKVNQSDRKKSKPRAYGDPPITAAIANKYNMQAPSGRGSAWDFSHRPP